MSTVIVMSQKAINKMASLPRDVQITARRVVEYLNTGNEKAVDSNKLKGDRDLYSARLKKDFRVIYSKKRETITIVDFIKTDDLSQVMRSDK